jgi:predicted transcriptional regulator
MENIVKILTELEYSRGCGVYRKFMTTDEIKLCNKLVKEGLIEKGKPAEANATLAFFITNKGSKYLENIE